MKLTPEQKIARRAKINRTAYKRRGLRIDKIDQLEGMALLKRSVYCLGCWGLLPAVFVMNMPASVVLSAIKRGELFEYLPQDSKE